MGTLWCSVPFHLSDLPCINIHIVLCLGFDKQWWATWSEDHAYTLHKALTVSDALPAPCHALALVHRPVLDLIGFDYMRQGAVDALTERAFENAGVDAGPDVAMGEAEVWEWSGGAENEDEAPNGEGLQGKGEQWPQSSVCREEERAATVAYVLGALPGELITELLAGITV